MYFPESEVIAREHPDLLPALQKIDSQLSAIKSSAPLNPSVFSSVLGADENQVGSVFELLAEHGVLDHEEMVQCERCQNLMRAKDFRRAVEDEDSFDCTGCGHSLHRSTKPIFVYRLSPNSRTRFKTKVMAEIEVTDANRDEAARLALTFDMELSHDDCENLAHDLAWVRDEGRREIDECLRDTAWRDDWVLRWHRGLDLYEVVDCSEYEERGRIAAGPTALAACRAALATVKEKSDG